ncbi:HlyD family efflux transporter periplasmic adaptor subunit [Nordella sp. HKS 07]|uniref:HlyD family secretion protein n=1 Tax=Nordella sp. HKS 07 TaxID=2712222 RepID=UPI0013E1B4B4|nr:HlyD family efflux transporter periplasmic adaptor subunit [Nordella sp. HKS 07]QIG47776.1 HlyD family efflux transporter periplasmic adaptor subunit [Nordella sp. HKS 07]
MSKGSIGKFAFVLLILAGAVAGYALWPSAEPAPVLGVVRATQLRVAPEVGGQLATIKVHKGDHVAAGDIVAELSALELTASVGQARAALAAARAERDHVYAGVRAEEVAVLADEIAKAQSNLSYFQKELDRSTYLVSRDFASQQALDETNKNVATAQAALAEAQAEHAAAVAGPTSEERQIADAQVHAAGATLAMLERRLDKTILRAPADGTVSVIVGEIGEAVRAGEPILAIEADGKPWLSINLREDALRGLTIGSAVNVERMGKEGVTQAVVSELMPLGPFATWQAERTVGDHDRNTLRLRLDLQSDWGEFQPGMTVRLIR